MTSRSQSSRHLGRRRRCSGIRPRILPNGFTLIELALVTVLLGMLVALTTPLFQRTFRTLAVEEAGRSLTRTMHFARERSILEGGRYRLHLDPEEGAYWLSVEDDGVFRRLPGRAGRTVRLPRGIRLETDQRHVTFTPNGAATDARLQFSSDEGAGLNLVLDGFTGRVEQQEVTGGR